MKNVHESVEETSRKLGVSVGDLYQFSNAQHKHYHKCERQKKDGGVRVLSVPNGYLKHIQRLILERYLYTMPVSEYAKAYSPETRLLDNAIPHVGKNKVLKMDIKKFFDNIDDEMVYRVFRKIVPEPAAASLLTNLCILNGCLPQGAPTSPYIANLVMVHFDERVGKFCKENNISYTRYCDDMTFSGDFDESQVIGYVSKQLYRMGFEVNHEKTVCTVQSQQQRVTGIVVNEKPQVSSELRRKLRQKVYYCKKFGIEEHLKQNGIEMSASEYAQKLLGRISFALQIAPDDKKLREYFEAVKQLMSSIPKRTFADIEAEAARAKSLDELFMLWQEAHCAEEYASLIKTDAHGFRTKETIRSFCHDVTDSKIYAELPMRIVFVVDKIDESKSEIIGRIAYYLLTGNRLRNGKTTQMKINYALKRCAVVAINKRKACSEKDTAAYAEKYRVFINKELELLRPDIIVRIGEEGFTAHAGKLYIRLNRLPDTYNSEPVWTDSYGSNEAIDHYMREFYGQVDYKTIREML